MNQERALHFKKHNDRGQSVLYSEFKNWTDPITGSEIFGPVISYSWDTNGEKIEFFDPKNRFTLHPLPDASGFICFESRWEPDNCVLLDAYGKERMRLTVPWQMTGATDPEAGQAPTSFDNISEPCLDPETGQPGKFGVTAHVAGFFGCKFYFELDYHSGQFLWCRRIRD